MSSSDNTKTSYFNTLVFTILAGIVSLCLMGLFFFDIGKEFMIFLITLEVGIFSIIAFTIYKIYRYGKDLDAVSQSGSLSIDFAECPDYYVKRQIDGKDYCFNDYTIRNSKGENFIVKVTPVSVGGTVVQVDTSSITASEAVDSTDPLYAKFELRKLQNDTSLPTAQQKCALMYNTPAKYNSTYSHLPSLPWSYATSRCDGFVNN